jgi:hypothetical protein
MIQKTKWKDIINIINPENIQNLTNAWLRNYLELLGKNGLKLLPI